MLTGINAAHLHFGCAQCGTVYIGSVRIVMPCAEFDHYCRFKQQA